MDKEKMLDEYIKDNYADIEPLTEEQKKMVSDSLSFQGFLLAKAWDELKEVIKQIFPFSLFWR